ncbi:helix-turn-helix transcriptional regulator [Amycolatopsis sp. NPDC006125]|uniref:helix-turn-helix domain-containing protein n=1 Tax=Amycolatopsis sp. NPDC006125 TaxID=3156730 RepID=UPI0033A99C8F
MTGSDVKRLADAVKAARGDLELSQLEFANRSGLGIATVQRIEREEVRPRGKTLTMLDRSAGWPIGTARAILERGIERPPSQPLDAAPKAPTDAPREPNPEGAIPDQKTDARQQLLEMSYQELGHVAALVEAAEGHEAAEAFLRKALKLRSEASELPPSGDESALQTGDSQAAS